jgi:hypothetical protein
MFERWGWMYSFFRISTTLCNLFHESWLLALGDFKELLLILIKSRSTVTEGVKHLLLSADTAGVSTLVLISLIDRLPEAFTRSGCLPIKDIISNFTNFYVLSLNELLF